MNKYIIVLLSAIVIFTLSSCIARYNLPVQLEEHPSLTIVNNTGLDVQVTSPRSFSLREGMSDRRSEPENRLNPVSSISYTIANNNYTAPVVQGRHQISTLTERPPILQVRNNTGHSIDITAPFNQTVANHGNSQRYPKDGRSQPLHRFTYRIGGYEFSRDVNINNEDVILTVTERPPTLTVRNGTGHPITITSPWRQEIANNATGTPFLKPNRTTNTITVTYQSFGLTFSRDVRIGNDDVSVTLTERTPLLTVRNNTGYPLSITRPWQETLAHGATSRIYPKPNREANSITVTYNSGTYTMSREARIGNSDMTLTLGADDRPAIVTLLNNTGNTVNLIFLRHQGTSDWGLSIVNRDTDHHNVMRPHAAETVGDVRVGSITNRESVKVWLGYFPPNNNFRFDIRLDDVRSTPYVKNNQHLTRDVTLTFTASDRP